ncbi:MAG: SDR family oxidoreductase [Acidimicrobiales bacterium]|jgi:NAD(P)-dependent dehydrogenase (short-subunit alcohol dehydrogenase family)|nr:SDR family oxidoreductase [Acidimicrobiales bacterium]
MTADLFSIEGKTALVTGGGQGIGRMISQGFVEAGARVYVASRKLEVVQQAADELSAIRPGSCIPVRADLSDHDECRRLADWLTEREGGRLDILVNNAGANWGAPYEEFPDAAWDRCLDVNVKGVFHLTRYLTPALAAAATPEDPARVINIGSIDGLHVPILDTYAYSASKAAVHHLTRVLARKLAPQHITVNAIAPGPFESKMMQATLDAFGDAIRSQVALGRIGSPEDMAGITVFLSSRAGAYLTGTVIPVDGGMSTTL